MDDSTASCDIELPGFRFHPTEEELLDFYLKNMVLGKKLSCGIIGYLNIYQHDPWDLPGLAKIGEREWYFFVPRDRRHGSGVGRPNRTTRRGFWKATGSDRKILSLSNPSKMIGLKKTLVFYTGRAPRGCKTDWIMNEYRLPDHDDRASHSVSGNPSAVVLCKIYRKATSLRVLEQRAGVDQQPEETKAPSIPVLLDHHATTNYYYASGGDPSSSPPVDDAASICSNIQQHDHPMPFHHHLALKREDEELPSGLDKKRLTITPTSPSATDDEEEDENDDDDDDDHNSLECKGKSRTCTNNLRFPTTTTTTTTGKKSVNKLAELQVPSRLSMDWTQDPFWAQFRSPWLDNLATPNTNYCADVLNF